jgi:hypothetical protein
MNLTTSLEPAYRAGAPDPAAGAPDPMRNAGYVPVAYLLFFACLGLWLRRSWQRQRALEARLGLLESSLGATGPGHPLVRVAGQD